MPAELELRRPLRRPAGGGSPSQDRAHDRGVLAHLGDRLVDPLAVPALDDRAVRDADARASCARPRRRRSSPPPAPSSPACASRSARRRCRRGCARSAARRPCRPAARRGPRCASRRRTRSRATRRAGRARPPRASERPVEMKRSDGHRRKPTGHRRSSTKTSVAAKAIWPNVSAVPVFDGAEQLGEQRAGDERAEHQRQVDEARAAHADAASRASSVDERGDVGARIGRREPLLGRAPPAERAQPALAVLGGEVRERGRAAGARGGARAGRAARGARRSAATSSSMPCAGGSEETATTGVSRSPTERSAALRSRRARSATSPRSDFVTTSTSGISMIPLLRNCSVSPEAGCTTTATVSATSATSVSLWPTPTVSTTTTSNAAASAAAASRVAGASPPSRPAAAVERMKTRVVGGIEGDARAVAEQRAAAAPRRRVDGEHGDAAARRRATRAISSDSSDGLAGAGRAGDADDVPRRLAAERGGGDAAQQRGDLRRAPRACGSRRGSGPRARRTGRRCAGARRARCRRAGTSGGTLARPRVRLAAMGEHTERSTLAACVASIVGVPAERGAARRRRAAGVARDARRSGSCRSTSAAGVLVGRPVDRVEAAQRRARTCRSRDVRRAVRRRVRPAGTTDEILGGLVPAALDIALWSAGERGDPGSGVVEAIVVAPAAEAPVVTVPEARALAGRGLEGDRYARRRRDVRLGAARQRPHAHRRRRPRRARGGDGRADRPPAQRRRPRRRRRTRSSAGRSAIGDVRCHGRRLCEPCAHLDRLNASDVLRPLVHRGGLRADILADGVLRVGDVVQADR